MNISRLPSFTFLKFQQPKNSDNKLAGDLQGVKHSSSWSYCGPLLETSGSCSLSTLPSSFHVWSASNIKGDLASELVPFLAYANNFLRANQLSNYWITIRATRPNDEFVKPRWHTDDLFYERYISEEQGERSVLSNASTASSSFSLTTTASSKSRRRMLPFLSQQPSPPLSIPLPLRWRSKSQPPKPNNHHSSSSSSSSFSNNNNTTPTNWKLTTTLLGPPTLLISATHQSHALHLQRQAKHACGKEHVCSSIRCVGCSTAASHVREFLNVSLQNTPIVSPRRGEALFFRVGHDIGAVHSEPDESVGDRVFVNIVPGKEEELKALMAKWGMEFPRHWAVVEGRLG